MKSKSEFKRIAHQDPARAADEWFLIKTELDILKEAIYKIAMVWGDASLLIKEIHPKGKKKK